jgi:hypothetical protein
MNAFSFVRFQRVLQNDALRMLRPVLYCTLAFLGLTVLLHATLTEAGPTAVPSSSTVVFGIYLLGGGLLLTSLAFHDMHHPLEGHRYLMLPCSNLERFLSRYLLTGPLLLLYVVLSFNAMDWLANQLTLVWINARDPAFSPLGPSALLMMRVYLVAQVLVLTGAICFRSLAMPRTVLFLLVAFAGFLAVLYATQRAFYWDHYSWTRWRPVRPLGFDLVPLFAAPWMNVVAATGFTLWMLRVAYRGLCTHEVQDGL